VTKNDAAPAHRGPSRSRTPLPRAIVLPAIGLPLLLILLAASPLGSDFFYVLIGIPTLLAVWAAVALWSLALGVRFALRKIWVPSCQAAILPIVVTLAGFHLEGFIRGCSYLGNVLHFVVALPYYEHVVAEMPRDGHPRLAVFNWGGMVWASYGLVYDESDEVALPPGRQSAAWRSNPNLGELSCGGFGVERLWSHYYLASFPC
jgi:hypothetical protein